MCEGFWTPKNFTKTCREGTIQMEESENTFGKLFVRLIQGVDIVKLQDGAPETYYFRGLIPSKIHGFS